MKQSLDNIVDELNRGRREIDKTVKSMDGWADGIMAAILMPLKENEIELLPRGKNIPQFGTRHGSMI